MQYRQLGRSGLRVSAFSLGTMTFGDSQTLMKGATAEDTEARRIFDRAIDAGINLIDTANIYNEGRSEELVGEWTTGKRDKLLIATKARFPVGLGMTGRPDPNEYGLSRKAIMDSCEASLRRLRTDHIDLYQSHMQDQSVAIDETMRAYEDLISQGKVRYIGCSNYSGHRLVESLWSADRLGTPRYESIQMQWSLIQRTGEWELVSAAKAHQLGVLVWAPLSRGFLSGKYRRDQPMPAGARLDVKRDYFKLLDTDKNWAILDAVIKVAGRHDTSPGAVALAWLLAQSAVSTVLIGARTEAQLEDNLAALPLKLTPEDIKALNAASEPKLEYPWDVLLEGEVNEARLRA